MKISATLLWFFLCFPTIFAQLPPACPISNPPLAKTCSQACILCDLDGYTAATTQTIQGQIIPGYCTQVVHSMGYMGFVAGSADLSIQVDVGTCTQGNSIEMGIYQTTDCQDFTLVSECNTAMFTGNTYYFNNLEPLVPGCAYFLVFDNNGPAACAFTVTVLSGSAAAPAVAAPELPAGPTNICPGATVTYTIPPVFGACQYRWSAPAGTTINGLPSPVTIEGNEGTTVTVTWGNQSGQLCVRGSNPCSVGPTTCLPVTVALIPPTVLAPIEICPGDYIEWIDGNIYGTSQTLSITLTTPYGCDSTVKQQLVVRQPNTTNLGILRICEGECLPIGNSVYCTAGNYQETLVSYAGCDSTLLFSIIVVQADALINTPDTIDCMQTSTILDGSGSTPGSSYSWTNPGGMTISTADTALANGPGQYRLIIKHTLGGLTCKDTAFVTVASNQQLPNLTVQGDTMNCDEPEGMLQASSSTPGVAFLWSGPGGFSSSDTTPVVSQPGVYFISVAAPNGCTLQDSVIVVSDLAPPVLSINPPDTLNCLVDTIRIELNASPPGIAFSWSGPQNFTSMANNPLVALPGLYSITATAANGCSSTAEVQVETDTLSPQISTTGDTITCSTPSVTLTLQLTPATALVQWTGPGGFMSNLPEPSVSSPGSYIATATSSNGCTAVSEALVAADILPPIATVADDTLNCTYPMVSLAANVTPAGSMVQWSGPQNFSSNELTPDVSIPGIYLLDVTAPNGCTATAQASITADTTAPMVSGAGDTLTCLQSAVNLTANFSPAGSSITWQGPQGFISNQTNPAVSIAGIYTATVIAPNGCSATAQATVTADASIPQVNVANDTLTCAKTSLSLAASVTPAGGSLLWSGPQNFMSTDLMPSVSVAGTYTLTVSTMNGCTAVAAAQVLADTVAPALNASGGIITCTQPTVVMLADVLPATAGLQWTGPQNFSSNLPGPQTIVSGTYTVLATTANGCTAQASVVVGIDTLAPQIILTGGILTCAQTTTGLSANISPANASFIWAGPQNFSSMDPEPVVGLAGFYHIVATATNGCTSQSTVEVNIDTLPPELSAQGGIITCAQPMLPLSAIFAPSTSTVLWSGPQNFSSALPNPIVSNGGTYQVVATAPNGCTTQTALQVNTDTISPQVGATGGILTCLQTTYTLLSNVQPSNSALLWSGPQNFSSTQPDPLISIPGVYTLLATAPNGCTASATAAVTIDGDYPQISTAGGTITCNAPTLPLSATVLPVGSIIQWSGPQNFTSAALNPIVDAAGIYILTATSANGCSTTATAIVELDTIAPQITASVGLITCAQPSTSLGATVLPAGSQITWTGPQGFSSNLPNPLVTMPGLYTVSAMAPNGCLSMSPVTVGADTVAPQVSASGGTITCLQPDASLSFTSSPASGSIQWSGPQNFTSNLPAPSVSFPGAYTVVITAPNGCTGTATTQVVADTQAPQVSAGGGIITCTTPILSLSANVIPASSVVLWAGPQNFSSSVLNPMASAPGTYVLTATGANGCSATAIAQLTADVTPPEIQATGGAITCLQDSVLLTAVVTPVGSSIVWSGPQNFISQLSQTFTTGPGVYTVIATAPNGCTSLATVSVDAQNQPGWTLGLGPDLEVEELDLIILTAQTDLPDDLLAEWAWEYPSGLVGAPCTSCPNPWFKLTASGTVYVQVTDIYGCSQSAAIQISVQRTSAIYVPNIFSPEGQATNQLFEVFASPEARISNIRSFRIFDRWGNQVFDDHDFLPGDPAHGWNGDIGGKQATPGVYVWYLEIDFENGRKKVIKGDVTLLR